MDGRAGRGHRRLWELQGNGAKGDMELREGVAEMCFEVCCNEIYLNGEVEGRMAQRRYDGIARMWCSRSVVYDELMELNILSLVSDYSERSPATSIIKCTNVAL